MKQSRQRGISIISSLGLRLGLMFVTTERFIEKTEKVADSFNEFNKANYVVDKEPSKYFGKSKRNYKK